MFKTMILDFKVEEKVKGSLICPGCEERVLEIETIHIGGENKGKPFTYYKHCKCEEIKLAKEAIELKRRLKSDYETSAFEALSLINPALLEANFNNYFPTTQKQQEAKKELFDFAESFTKKTEPRNFILSGSYGVGKSHLAVSVVHELLKKGFSCLFVYSPKLLTKIRSTYKSDADHDEWTLLQAIENVDLLVLDDIGAENTTAWTDEKFSLILDSRLGKSNIFTTNHDSKGLAEKIGGRNISRVANNRTSLTIDGKDHRIG